MKEVGSLSGGLRRRIGEEINRHFVLYSLIFFVFLAGTIAGMHSLDSLNIAEKQNALNYVNSAFGFLKGASINWYRIFFSSLYNNAIFFIPLILAGLFTITIPFVFVVICAKGYLLGFSLFFIISSYKFLGIFIALLCIILPSLISLPCYFLMSKLAVLNGLNKFSKRDIPRTNREIVNSMSGYISDAVIMSFFLCAALLLEAVMMPIIMSYILRLY